MLKLQMKPIHSKWKSPFDWVVPSAICNYCWLHSSILVHNTVFGWAGILALGESATMSHTFHGPGSWMVLWGRRLGAPWVSWTFWFFSPKRCLVMWYHKVQLNLLFWHCTHCLGESKIFDDQPEKQENPILWHSGIVWRPTNLRVSWYLGALQ